MEADAVWNVAHAGMKSIIFAAADIDGDVKISCTLTANGATYGSITVDGNMDASHTPADLDANDIFVIEDGYLKVTTSRDNVYVLENGTLKAAGAKLNGSIMAETKLFASQPEDIVEFSYNHNGLRTQKKVTKADGTVETTDYMLHGKLVTYLTSGEDEMHFFYGAQSRPAMVEFNGTLYSYAHNLQGDIVGIIDSNGNLVVEYKYDAWGKPVVVRTLTTAYETLAEMNPFRYREYVWDEETELYYLRSRYYNAISLRFVNEDEFGGVKGKLISHNIFAYCNNAPIKNKDNDGRILGLAIIVAGLAITALSLTRCSSSNTTESEYSGHANCYAYASKLSVDPRTGKPFTRRPQPGEFSGEIADMYYDNTAKAVEVKMEMMEAVERDCEVLGLTFAEVSSNAYVCEEGEWLVALAYAPGRDYHWWRKDEDGTWSHKSGITPIKTVDDSGEIITDPGECDRGIYTEFWVTMSFR